MCATCGCSGGEVMVAHHHDYGPLGDHHHHAHQHPSHDSTPTPRDAGRTALLRVEQAVLARNDEQAARNRTALGAEHIFAINLVSSPGAGKTTLLERTIREVGESWPIQVIEGDQETDLDARRIRATGCRAVQVNTGTGCHLDASMVERGLQQLAPLPGSMVIIENVGNLVCPALFDLGEHARVLVSAVTEGEDKPVKYPHMFRSATLVLLNKIDLLPYVSFDPSRFQDYAHQVNPRLQILALSATRGDGLAEWYRWLHKSASDATG